MESVSDQWQTSVPLKESADSTPLKGAVICCTSVPDEKRTELAKHAQNMGAIHRYDLTQDVTHLIVGDYDTPKYRYVAKERPDVRPMTASWIEAMRELWMNDQEVDIEALEREHTLPTFASLRFSMTGCDDPIERTEIAEQVKANGATYEGDLTKQITHLISFRTEGAKYKAAKTWGLRIVSIEWLRDSLERGMILDEKLYDPALPLEERGVGAWDRNKPKKKTTLGKRTREESETGLAGPKRRLRRSASSKLNSQSDGLWGDITSTGGGLVTQVQRSGVWESTDEQTQRESSTTLKAPTDSSSIMTVAAPEPPVVTGIFSGCRFFLGGFEPKKSLILYKHLAPNGGEMVESVEDLSAESLKGATMRKFRMIPSTILEDDSSSTSSFETITEFWLERCLHNKQFLEPSDHIIGQPFPKFPIEGFQELTINSAAFTGIDLLHVTKSVRLIGAIYTEDLTPQTSILLTKSVTALRKDKAEHAHDWKIPIVNATWLWDCIAAGEKLPIQKYKFKTLARAVSLPSDKSASKNSQQAERSKSNLARSFQNTEPDTSHSSKPLRNSRLDKTAFISDEPYDTKEEINTQNQGNLILDPSASMKSEPLSERSQNISLTVSTAPAPSNHPAPRPAEDFSNDISDLLTKTKTAQPAPADAPDGRKRGVNRILGRAASNVSTGSIPLSRASSVDSTATHGNAVEYPPYTHKDKDISGPATAQQEQIGQFISAANDRDIHQELESQPASTQLEYEDPQSRAYKERVMARMLGEDVVPQRKGLAEKAITLGDLSDSMQMQPRGRRNAGRTPGFR